MENFVSERKSVATEIYDFEHREQKSIILTFLIFLTIGIMMEGSNLMVFQTIYLPEVSIFFLRP